MKKGRDMRYGTGGPFARAIHEIAYLDQDSKGPDDVYYSGKLAADLNPESSSRLTASNEGASIKMTFLGVEGERMCFRALFSREVGEVGSKGRRDYDPVAYVDSEFRAHHFGAELVAAYDAPEVQKRDHLFPKANFSQLDEIELIEQRAFATKRKEYLINAYRVCGKALAMPEPKPKMLTVAVQLKKKPDEAYLLLWTLGG
jgi:hypothetical protein